LNSVADAITHLRQPRPRAVAGAMKWAIMSRLTVKGRLRRLHENSLDAVERLMPVGFRLCKGGLVPENRNKWGQTASKALRRPAIPEPSKLQNGDARSQPFAAGVTNPSSPAILTMSHKGAAHFFHDLFLSRVCLHSISLISSKLCRHLFYSFKPLNNKSHEPRARAMLRAANLLLQVSLGTFFPSNTSSTATWLRASMRSAPRSHLSSNGCQKHRVAELSLPGPTSDISITPVNTNSDTALMTVVPANCAVADQGR